MKITVRREAKILGTYLLRARPSDAAISLYERAMSASPTSLSTIDKRLLTYMHKYPRQLGFIDAGAQLLYPKSEVRRRLYVMFSILETVPEYHNHFLPQKHSFWYLFALVFFGIRGIAKAIVGVVIVKVVSR